MQELRTPLREGDRVEVRGESWVLVATDPQGACTFVTLRGCGTGNAGETCVLVSPFDQPRLRRRRARWQLTGRGRALRAAARVVVEAPPSAALRAAFRARMTLLPWQFAPALAIVAGHPRILIADEVGLGKTTQAALIIAELRERREAARVLVLTPAGLRAQWVGELKERCGLDAVLVDQAQLARDRALLPRGLNPWCCHALAVISIDLIRQPEVLSALGDVPFDLLVVDEAHHAAFGTDRGRAVARLAAQALRVVLLTATPHSGDEGAYRALCGVGDLGLRRPPLVFRRTHADAGLDLPRRTHVLRVAPTDRERVLFAALESYLMWLSNAAGKDARVPLLTSVLIRRAASGPHSLARTLARRRALLAPHAAREPQLRLPWEELDGRDDCVPDHVVGTHLDVDRSREEHMLERLLATATQASTEAASKTRALTRLLRRLAEPAIVFTEYRDTLDDVRPWLESAGSVVTLHGGLMRLEREAAVRSFVEGPAQWLLATDAGSEGLNLHARCRVAINLERPSGPTRFAQRAGRVSRLGQTRAVHVFTLMHAGGLDEPGLSRFDDRRAVVEEALSPRRRPDRAIVEGFDRGGRREAERLASLRRLAEISPARRPGGRRERVSCGLGTRNGPGRSWRLVVSADVRDETGRLVETTVMGLTADWPQYPPRDWRDVRRALSALLVALDRSGVCDARAAALAAERSRENEGLLERARELTRRASAIPGRHQPSLFDHRAERAASSLQRRLAEAVSWWQAHVERLERARRPLRTDAPALRAAYTVALPVASSRKRC